MTVGRNAATMQSPRVAAARTTSSAMRFDPARRRRRPDGGRAADPHLVRRGVRGLRGISLATRAAGRRLPLPADRDTRLLRPLEAHGRGRGARSGDAWRLHRGGVAPDGHLWGAGSLVYATRDPRGTAPVHAPDRSRLEPVVVRVRGQRG